MGWWEPFKGCQVVENPFGYLLFVKESISILPTTTAHIPFIKLFSHKQNVYEELFFNPRQIKTTASIHFMFYECIPAQTLSPHNKGLFKRAISQSGVAFCPWAMSSTPRMISEQVCHCQTSLRWILLTRKKSHNNYFIRSSFIKNMISVFIFSIECVKYWNWNI